MNWHTPFIWSQIETAARAVGVKMSSTEIVKELQKRNPDTFSRLRHSTVNEWIDRKDGRPHWKEKVMVRVKRGNNPGHKNGGRRGILVSTRQNIMTVDLQ